MKIIVAVATHGRPKLLGELLDTFIDMERPELAEVTFLIVENHTIAEAAPVVDGFRSRITEHVAHVTEERRGIPFARNTALEWALRNGADVLCFVDDDGEVSRNWLKNLVGTLVRRQLDLVGGPIEPVATEPLKSRRAATVLAGWQCKYASMRNERNNLAASADDGQLNIYTHNWAARLDIIRKAELRFDDAMCETGGSDSAFSIALRAAGGRSGWAGDAVVTDKLPPERLTLSYLWKRGLSQGMVSAALSKGLSPRPPLVISIKIIAGIVVFSAFDRGRSIQKLYSLAFQWGQWLGLRGRRARQYEIS
jgi:glycosyltransferase involved in cell wall biosynthesis